MNRITKIPKMSELDATLSHIQRAVAGFNDINYASYKFLMKKFNFTPDLYLFNHDNLDFVSKNDLFYENENMPVYKKKTDEEKIQILLNTIKEIKEHDMNHHLIFKLFNNNYLYFNCKDDFYFTFSIKKYIIKKLIYNQSDTMDIDKYYHFTWKDIIQNHKKINISYIIKFLKQMNAEEEEDFKIFILPYII
jgi:hypothetical protein